MEPARLDCPFISGVHVENWPVYAELQVADATRCVTVDALDDYFQKAVVDHPALATMAKRARAFVDGRDQENLTVAGRLVGMLTP